LADEEQEEQGVALRPASCPLVAFLADAKPYQWGRGERKSKAFFPLLSPSPVAKKQNTKKKAGMVVALGSCYMG
jgi:hypothetical protein